MYLLPFSFSLFFALDVFFITQPLLEFEAEWNKRELHDVFLVEMAIQFLLFLSSLRLFLIYYQALSHCKTMQVFISWSLVL